MQKLSKRNTYTPTDISLVCSNCGSTLNSSEGRSSVLSLKTSDNISEEALTAQRGTGWTDILCRICPTKNLYSTESDPSLK